MTEPDPPPADAPLPGTYSDLLGDAAGVAARAVGRLHGLHDRYPSALPPPVIDQIDRAHADPAAERRGAVRLPGASQPVPIRTDAAGPGTATVVDQSPGGLALRVGVVLLPGAVVAVHLPGGCGWTIVEVRHTHPDRDAWVVGCAFAADRPAA